MQLQGVRTVTRLPWPAHITPPHCVHAGMKWMSTLNNYQPWCKTAVRYDTASSIGSTCRSGCEGDSSCIGIWAHGEGMHNRPCHDGARMGQASKSWTQCKTWCDQDSSCKAATLFGNMQNGLCRKFSSCGVTYAQTGSSTYIKPGQGCYKLEGAKCSSPNQVVSLLGNVGGNYMVFGSRYHLNSAGTNGCSGWGQSPSQADCLDAAIQAVKADSGSSSASAACRNGLSIGCWGHVIAGCSTQSGGDWAAHYNTCSGSSTGYSSVCTGPR